jgi:hypothetical protein
MSDPRHAVLGCARCGAATDHELHYAGRLLVSSSCTVCGLRIDLDVRRRYLSDLASRIRSKPRRVVRRLRHHPVTFTAGLPRSTVVKPLRMIDEVRLVLAAAERARRRTEQR